MLAPLDKNGEHEEEQGVTPCRFIFGRDQFSPDKIFRRHGRASRTGPSTEIHPDVDVERKDYSNSGADIDE